MNRDDGRSKLQFMSVSADDRMECRQLFDLLMDGWRGKVMPTDPIGFGKKNGPVKNLCSSRIKLATITSVLQ
jgi:hypothetical protein